MEIDALFDERTFTLTYILFDRASRDAVVIDPVLDYDPAASKIWEESVERVARFIGDNGLALRGILETHAHADHLSGSQALKRRFEQAPVVIGRGITKVQETFKHVFGLPDGFATDGSQFDRLLDDEEVFEAGTLRIQALFTPGHTPACVTYRAGDALFTGDAMFMPDMGTGRCDFPAGSAEQLYDSITGRIYSLADETRVFVGHDYQPGGRDLAYETTVGEQKRSNKQLTAKTSREEFVRFRRERDSTLSAPKLLLQSVQVNIDAGRLPPAESNEIRYLKIPLNVF